MGCRIDNECPSFPNMIRFQFGKRKKEFNASQGDECITGNSDEGDEQIIGKAGEARIYANGTPVGNKKIKLLKTSPTSLQPHTGIQSYKSDTRIFSIKDRIRLKRSDADYGTGNVMDKEKFDVGRSLDMLVEAIQLIEGQRLSRIVDRLVQGKDLTSRSPQNINNFGRPSLQNQEFRANDCFEASNKVVLGGKPSHTRHNCTGISKAVDIDSKAVLRTRSRGGWLPTLPSKYADSVLQPWKKVARKCPNLLQDKGLPTLPSKYADSVLQPWKKVARKCPNLLQDKGV